MLNMKQSLDVVRVTMAREKADVSLGRPSHWVTVVLCELF